MRKFRRFRWTAQIGSPPRFSTFLTRPLLKYPEDPLINTFLYYADTLASTDKAKIFLLLSCAAFGKLSHGIVGPALGRYRRRSSAGKWPRQAPQARYLQLPICGLRQGYAAFCSLWGRRGAGAPDLVLLGNN